MKDLTKGQESRLILNFALPMLLGNVFQQLYNIVDSVIVGNFIGKEALAAVGASFPIIFTLISLIIGIAFGTTIVIAQYFGAKDIANVRKAIDTLYIFLFFTSIIVTVVGIRFSEPIFRLLRLPEEILPQAKSYMNVYMLGAIAFFGFNGTSAILRGLGDSKTPMYFLIISTFFNIGFDLLFVLVFKWGIVGVAVATIIAQGGAFLTAVIYLNKYHQVIQVSVFRMKFDRDIFLKSFRIGLPTGFQHTFVALGRMALLGIVNTFGTDVIAAYSVAGRIDSIAALPAMNFSAALATFVGQNLGANKPLRVRAGFHATLWMSSLISLTVTVLVLFFGEFFMSLFTPDPEVIRIGREYLVIVSSFYLIFSALFTTSGVMRGAGDTLVPMFITLFSLWIVRIPLSYLLSRSMGETGIWWAIPIGWSMGLTISYAYYLTGRWKKKVVVKYQQPETEEIQSFTAKAPS
ncbi:MAG: MATE family efflux transporter [Bacteroidales bacterium]|nr:MAG: MATE family efflux transporter [Bacteroidales bacterium]